MTTELDGYEEVARLLARAAFVSKKMGEFLNDDDKFDNSIYVPVTFWDDGQQHTRYIREVCLEKGNTEYSAMLDAKYIGPDGKIDHVKLGKVLSGKDVEKAKAVLTSYVACDGTVSDNEFHYVCEVSELERVTP